MGKLYLQEELENKTHLKLASLTVKLLLGVTVLWNMTVELYVLVTLRNMYSESLWVFQ